MPHAKSDDLSRDLLAWYDRHARILPWRSPPGAPLPDPYRVWLSEIMLQQTTVAAVKPYFSMFTVRWPDIVALAAAEDADVMSAWAGLGYYARARNLLACARAVVRDHGGRFPSDEAVLLTLPGIGSYTAAAIAAIAFGQRAVVVDGNVERVVSRLFAVETSLPAAKPLLHAHAAALTPDARAGDHAQAMMDLGATICTPRKPACALCPLSAACAARRTAAPEAYPRKMPRKVRPVRHGTVFWLEHEGAVLLVRRPSSGLLGGMRALPTGPWVDAPPGLADAPLSGRWTVAEGNVAHVFTHFALELSIAGAVLEKGCNAKPDGEWWPIERLDAAGLPSVFAKAAGKALRERDRWQR